jgi:hypothetical protein
MRLPAACTGARVRMSGGSRHAAAHPLKLAVVNELTLLWSTSSPQRQFSQPLSKNCSSAAAAACKELMAGRRLDADTCRRACPHLRCGLDQLAVVASPQLLVEVVKVCLAPHQRLPGLC